VKKRFFIKSRDFVHAGEASIAVQNILKSLKVDPVLVRRIAICSYEGEMNVVMHGEDGSLELDIDDDRITLSISDSGPGMDDVGLCMQPGYSTASDELREMGFGAGMGLPNMKKNAERFSIDSRKGEGTRVEMCFSWHEVGSGQ
jgi:anti-sigma regulatory factor (Ser/Thr protein kinase)